MRGMSGSCVWGVNAYTGQEAWREIVGGDEKQRAWVRWSS